MRVDHGVVEPAEVGVMEVAAHLDVAEKAESRLFGDPLVGARDRFELRMIRGHSEPDEPPGRGEALDHVHLRRHLAAEQRAGRVEARRA
jgi:hypothetical protein